MTAKPKKRTPIAPGEARPKFLMGETVFFLYDSVIEEATITAILLCKEGFFYCVRDYARCQDLNSSHFRKDTTLFCSKEELKDSL